MLIDIGLKFGVPDEDPQREWKGSFAWLRRSATTTTENYHTQLAFEPYMLWLTNTTAAATTRSISMP